MVRSGALMWILAVLEGSYALQEKYLSLRKLATSTRRRREDGCECKRSAFDQPFANVRTDSAAITRHCERPNKVSRIVDVDQEKWCPRTSPNHVGGRAECGRTSERGDQEIAVREAAQHRIKFRVPERHMRDPFPSELRGEGEARLNGAALCGKDGECRREPSYRGVRWAGYEEDPHGAMMAYSPDEPTTYPINRDE